MAKDRKPVNEELENKETELDEAGNTGKHAEMLHAAWKTLTDKKKDKDKDVKKEEVVNEDDIKSEAGKTLHAKSRDFPDAKSRIEMMKSVIGHMASMTDDSLQKWHNDAIAQIGHEADKVGDVEGKNKDSIGMQPSDATGSQDGSGTFKMPLVSVKEDLDVLFSKDETLTEEAKETMTTLFEAAVSARLMLEREELEEQYVEVLAETAQEIREELEGQLDSYLDYVVQSWLEENTVAIDSTLRMELAEEFIDSMRDVFANHFINIPEEEVDIVEALTAKVEELEESLNDAVVLVNELRGETTQAELEDVFDELSSDLSDAQKEKFGALAEGIEFNGDMEKFAQKLTVIKENFFPAPTPKEVKDDMEGEGEVITEELTVDPKMKLYAQAIAKKS